MSYLQQIVTGQRQMEEAAILVPVLARWASALVYHSVWQPTSLLGGLRLWDCLPIPWVLLQLFLSWSRCVLSTCRLLVFCCKIPHHLDWKQ